MVDDYCLVVPSRGRPQNMHRIQTLLPTAKIVVAEAEKERYLLEVDAEKLVTHPGEEGGIIGMPRVWNWMVDHFTEETFVEIDDDLEFVLGWTGDGARKTWNRLHNPEDILQIIENGVQIARDLNITTFTWGKAQNPAMAKMDHKPIVPVGLACNAVGVRGAARRRKYDTQMYGRSAVDWSLRTLLADRAMLVDKRFFFSCGRIFSGVGGNAGYVTEERFRKSTQALKDTWGRHVSFGGFSGGTAGAGARGNRKDKFGRNVGIEQGDRIVTIKVSRYNKGAER